MPAFAGMTAAIVVGPGEGNRVQHVEVAVIGTGWCGGIRAETLSRSALVDKLHICEIRPDRLAEVKALTSPASATLDYRSEEHTSELQSRQYLVCRLLLEKKKTRRRPRGPCGPGDDPSRRPRYK